MKKINTIFGRIITVFFLFFIYLFFNQHQSILYHDALWYWKLSGDFFEGGVLKSFSITRFNEPLRGYFFPLIIIPANVFSSLSGLSPLLVSKGMGSFFAAILLGFALPEFWLILSKKPHINYLSIFLLAILVIIFWGDHFSFTLTDFPSFTMLLCSFVFINRKKWYYIFIAGFLLAAAINLRPGNLIVLPFFVLLFFFNYKYYLKNKLLIIYFITGFALVTTPQFLINRVNSNSNYPFVLGKLPKGQNLYLWHLYWAMKIQKFETLHPESDVPYYVTDDPAGEKLLNKVNNGNKFKSAEKYLKGFVDFPIEYVGMYWRHLFNELDVKYSTPYIISAKLYWYKNILNYFLLFSGGLLLIRILRRSNRDSIIMIIGFLAIVGVSLPIVPEPRFAMPIHLLILSALVYSKSFSTYRRFFVIKGVKIIPIIFLCLIWIVSCISASDTAGALTSLKIVFDH